MGRKASGMLVKKAHKALLHLGLRGCQFGLCRFVLCVAEGAEVQIHSELRLALCQTNYVS